MNASLSGVSWAERASHYDRLAERYREAGNERDACFAETNAKTMRLCAEQGEPVDA